jgi:hypothetical protein
MKSDRRSFLGRVAGLSAAALVGTAHDAKADEPAAAPWDLSWAESLTGKHKQVFDFGSMDMSDRDMAAGDSPLRVVRNWLNAHREVYGLEPPQVNTVVGISYDAFPMNVTDAIWKKYSLGERWKIKDSTTGTWAIRNLLSSPSAPITDRASTLEAMRQRGTIFWQCNNALGGVVSIISSDLKIDPGALREELIAGFMPGVKLVPAHTMMLGLVQERGATYEKV